MPAMIYEACYHFQINDMTLFLRVHILAFLSDSTTFRRLSYEHFVPSPDLLKTIDWWVRDAILLVGRHSIAAETWQTHRQLPPHWTGTQSTGWKRAGVLNEMGGGNVDWLGALFQWTGRREQSSLCVCCLCIIWSNNIIGPIRDDGLKEKHSETLKGCPLYSLSCVCLCLAVCMSVCPRATKHTF